MKTKIYIQVLGDFIEVRKTVFHAFYNSCSSERKRLQQEGKCFCPQKMIWKCDCDCINCPFSCKSDREIQEISHIPRRTFEYSIASALKQLNVHIDDYLWNCEHFVNIFQIQQKVSFSRCTKQETEQRKWIWYESCRETEQNIARHRLNQNSDERTEKNVHQR